MSSNTSAERVSRMLALVPWLIAHDGVTIEQTALHFEVSPEQLEKDLWLLIVCGLPGYGPDQLVDIDFWDDGRIHVIDPQTLDRPLRLGSEEAMSLLLGLRMLEQVPGVHDRSAIVSATDKLTRAVDLPDDEAAVSAEPGIDPVISAAVATAINLRSDLQITYASGTSDAVSERRVSPHQVVLADGRAYLEGYCHLAGALRTFRLDRMIAVSAATGAAEEAIVPSFQEIGSSALLAVAPGSAWIVDVLGGQIVGTEADGRIQVRVEYADRRWLIRLVLSRAGQVEVLEPASVRQEVSDAAERALRAYAGS
jgi:proteasome accessory factor C